MEAQQEQTTSESIIEQARAAEQSGASIVSPGTQKAKKRGRPSGSTSVKKEEKTEKKTDSSEKKQTIPTKVLCYPVVRVISNVGVAVLKDPRAKMSMEEGETCAEGLALLFDKYLPTLMGDYGVEIAAFTAFGQYGLKLYAIKQLQIKEAATQAKPPQENTDTQKTSPGIQPDSDNRAVIFPESNIT
jgi:hypothetical protein